MADRNERIDLRDVGIVVIGRNEALRLPACLASLPADLPICFVDSGSTDASRDIAASAGVMVLPLDPTRPFTAARARNEGAACLLKRHPDIGYLFFIDGDCQLAPAFLPAAVAALAADPAAAVIVGQLEETNSSANVYGLLAQLEWSSPGPGEIIEFGQLGGIMLVRRDPFAAVSGFDPAFIAGEDSEFGIRLHLAGYRTLRIAQTMAFHAMDMDRFGQWWRRSVRAGHAMTQRYARHGHSQLADCRSAVRSTLAYGLGIPGLALVGVATLGPAGLAPLLAYLYLAQRFFSHYRGKGALPRAALIGATFGIAGKFANLVGLIRFFIQRARGQFRLIEYK